MQTWLGCCPASLGHGRENPGLFGSAVVLYSFSLNLDTKHGVMTQKTVFFTQSSLVNNEKLLYASAAVKFSSPDFQFKAVTTRNRNCCIPVLVMVITYLPGLA